jgi:hypothetical protein
MSSITKAIVKTPTWGGLVVKGKNAAKEKKMFWDVVKKWFRRLRACSRNILNVKIGAYVQNMGVGTYTHT